jgi:hypothetical protein
MSSLKEDDNSMEQNPTWKANSHSASQKFPTFYGTHSSQEPATGLYRQSDVSSPQLPTLLP